MLVRFFPTFGPQVEGGPVRGVVIKAGKQHLQAILAEKLLDYSDR